MTFWRWILYLGVTFVELAIVPPPHEASQFFMCLMGILTIAHLITKFVLGDR